MILVLKNKICPFGFLIFASWNIIKAVHAFTFSLLIYIYIYFLFAPIIGGVNELIILIPNPSQVIIKDPRWWHRHNMQLHPLGGILVSLRDGKYISLLCPFMCLNYIFLSLSLSESIILHNYFYVTKIPFFIMSDGVLVKCLICYSLAALCCCCLIDECCCDPSILFIC